MFEDFTMQNSSDAHLSIYEVHNKLYTVIRLMTVASALRMRLILRR